jgi:hypothetical protein
MADDAATFRNPENFLGPRSAGPMVGAAWKSAPIL